MSDALRVVSGTLPATETTFFTVPTGRALIITEIRLTNRTATARTATVRVGAGSGLVIFPGRSIAANDGFLQTGIQTVVLAGGVIRGIAAVADAIDYYISAVEVVV